MSTNIQKTTNTQNDKATKQNVLRTVEYWIQFHNNKFNDKFKNNECIDKKYILDFLAAAEMASFSKQFVQQSYQTSFVGNLAYLSRYLQDPELKKRSFRIFMTIVQHILSS